MWFHRIIFEKDDSVWHHFTDPALGGQLMDDSREVYEDQIQTLEQEKQELLEKLQVWNNMYGIKHLDSLKNCYFYGYATRFLKVNFISSMLEVVQALTVNVKK